MCRGFFASLEHPFLCDPLVSLFLFSHLESDLLLEGPVLFLSVGWGLTFFTSDSHSYLFLPCKRGIEFLLQVPPTTNATLPAPNKDCRPLHFSFFPLRVVRATLPLLCLFLPAVAFSANHPGPRPLSLLFSFGRGPSSFSVFFEEVFRLLSKITRCRTSPRCSYGLYVETVQHFFERIY